MLSDVFEQLLLDKDNDIFSLEKVLGSPDQCSSLILILSNSLEKDFHSLDFPDPLTPGNKIQVSYMLQSEYNELEKEPRRKSICGTLIFFMIRLVTLVAAIVASLKVNNNIVNLLDLVRSQTVGTYNKNYKRIQLDNVQKKELNARFPLSTDIINKLKVGGLKQVFTEDNKKEDPRNLYYYIQYEQNPNPIVIDAVSSIIYFAKGEKSGIYGVEINEIAQSNIKRLEERIMTGGKTRHRQRKHKRQSIKRRVQRGGDKTLYSVHLKKLFCATPCEEIPEFYMETDGTTYDVDDYLEKLQGKQISIPSKTLLERIQLLESSPLDKMDLVIIREDDSVLETYGPLSKVDKETLKHFRTIQTVLNTKQEGTSHCFYRAYLLASRFDDGTLQTLVCSDSLEQKKITSQVGFSLLQSLYYDRPDSTMDSQTADECLQTITQLSTVFDLNNAAGYVPTLDNLSFQPLPPEIRQTICKTQDKGGRSLREAKRLNILMSAHQTLHILFENHIKSSIELLSKIMSLEPVEGYLSKPKVKLAPIFLSDPLGSTHALEMFIKEARFLISAHYLQVETVYQDALKELVQMARGNVPQPAPGQEILAAAAEKLPNVQG